MNNKIKGRTDNNCTLPDFEDQKLNFVGNITCAIQRHAFQILIRFTTQKIVSHHSLQLQKTL